MWLHYKSRKPFAKLSDFPKGTYGFVYMITNMDTGRKYIGKKQLISERWKTIAKSTYDRLKSEDKERTDIRKTKNKRKSKKGSPVWIYAQYAPKEMDWLGYTGSNKELNSHIQAGANIEKVIIGLAKSKKALTYLETRWLFDLRVLEKENYYNDNILGSFYTNDLI